jgi:hypothetical protein
MASDAFDLKRWFAVLTTRFEGFHGIFIFPPHLFKVLSKLGSLKSISLYN